MRTITLAAVDALAHIKLLPVSRAALYSLYFGLRLLMFIYIYVVVVLPIPSTVLENSL